jgi:hypothetical protein
VCRQLGDEEGLALAYLNLAIVTIEQDRLADARPLLRDALGLATRSRSMAAGQSVVDVASALAAREGAHEEAALLSAAADALIARTGFPRDEADSQFIARELEQARARLGAGLARFEAAGRSLGYDELMSRVARLVDRAG